MTLHGRVSIYRFVPAEAMHLANQLNWSGPRLGTIPFPKIGSQSEASVLPKIWL